MRRIDVQLVVKNFEPTGRRFSGIATSPDVDRMGDVIEPSGIKFAKTIPLCLFHDKSSPVGIARLGTPGPKGTPFEAEIPEVIEPGIVKDLTDRAAHLVKYGLVGSVSIGFRPIDEAIERIKGGLRFLKTEILELSLVTVPAHQAATIQYVRSLSSASAAQGTARTSVSSPGVSGTSKATPMNASEQLAAERSTLQIKSARMEELMQASDTEGGLEESDTTELSTLEKDVADLTKKIGRLTALEAAQAAQAGTVLMPVHAPRTSTTRGRIEVVNHAKELPKGALFTRYAMAVAAGKGSISDTLAYAKRWDSQTPEVSMYIKAVAGTSVVQSPGWGGELVNEIGEQFVELLRPLTIIGRVPGFRNVPFNTAIITQIGGSTIGWVGEGGSKGVGELAFERSTLPYHKVAGIVVLTEELIRLSNPKAEETVRQDLVEQCAKFLDEQFIQVGITAGANNPASITNGVASPAAGGTTLAFLLSDLRTALATFDTAGVSTDGLVIVTTPAVARILSMMVTPTLGQAPAGFNVSPIGGTLLGYPVIVSASVDAATLVIFKPSEVFLADDGRVSLDASNQATLDMDGGSPATPTFNLWQRNCVGIRAEQWITWLKRRSAGVVAVIDTIAYVPGT